MGNLSTKEINEFELLLKKHNEDYEKYNPIEKFIENSLKENFYNEFIDICRCSNDGSLCYEEKCMRSYISKFVSSIEREYLQTVYDMLYSLSTEDPYKNMNVYKKIDNFVNKQSSIQRFFVDIMEDDTKNLCICDKPNSICTTTYATRLSNGRLDFKNQYKITKCKKYIETSYNEYKKIILIMFETHICKDASLIISEYII